MSIKFQRFAPPPEGKTLLLTHWDQWKDPRLEGKKEPLESEKGAFIPSWTQIFTMSGVLAALTTAQHLRGLGRW